MCQLMQIGISVAWTANSVDPDGTAHYDITGTYKGQDSRA